MSTDLTDLHKQAMNLIAAAIPATIKRIAQNRKLIVPVRVRRFAC